jgi:Putative zinc-finger
MSTINNPQPESPGPGPDPASEELVAYLDGELSPEECRRVEERLAGDVGYREQLQDLDQAWEALDSLPSTKPGDDFARTTIEMVAMAAQQERKTRTTEAALATRKRHRLWAVAGGVAVLASFVAARFLLPDANANLLGDLPVLTRMHLLTQIQDVDFLERLSKEVPLDKLAADETSIERELSDFKAASESSPDARRRWVESLSAEQKADLAAQAEYFRSLPPEEQDRLKKLERAIAAAPDADRLQKTLAAYGQFINRRTSGEQSRLRGLTTDDRIGRIREGLRQENEQAARRLSETDAKQLKQELIEIYNEIQDKEDFAKYMRRREKDDRLRHRDPTLDEKALFAGSWALWDNNDIDDKTQERIKRDLTPEAQRHLDELKRRGGERRVKVQLWQWMRDAMLPNREAGEIERFFAEELDENQRERLLSLRKDEMEARLEQMYLGSRFGIRGAEWLGSFGEPGRGPGMGPGPGRQGWRPDGPPGPDGRRRGPLPDRPPLPRPDGPPPPDAARQEPI